MKQIRKGSYGYIRARRNRVILQTILFFGISFLIFLTGYLYAGTRKNIFTIIAVFGCLPSSKSMVNMIMFCRARGCSEPARKEIQQKEDSLMGMYDMYFTSYQKNFDVSHMTITDKAVLAYTEDLKFDHPAFQKHLTDMLNQGGCRDMTVASTDDLKKYCEQLQNLKEKTPDQAGQKREAAQSVLCDISL